MRVFVCFVLLLLLFLCSMVVADYYNHLRSPCDNVFRYGYDESGGLHGIVVVESPNDDLVQLNVDLSVGNPVQGFNGQLELVKAKSDVVLDVMERKPIMYKLIFPQWNAVPPKVTRISVNGRDVCYGPPITDSRITTTINLQHKLHIDIPKPAHQPHPPQPPNQYDLAAKQDTRLTDRPFLDFKPKKPKDPIKVYNSNPFLANLATRNPIGDDDKSIVMHFHDDVMTKADAPEVVVIRNGRPQTVKGQGQSWFVERPGGDRGEGHSQGVPQSWFVESQKPVTVAPTMIGQGEGVPKSWFTERPVAFPSMDLGKGQGAPQTWIVENEKPVTSTIAGQNQGEGHGVDEGHNVPKTWLVEQKAPGTVASTTSNKGQGQEGVPYGDVCGRSMELNSLIVKGEAVPRGAFPWLAAMFVIKNLGPEFRCSGSLISNRHVVTAAHCVKSATPLRPDELLLVLGKLNIRNWAEEGIQVGVERVEVHRDYEPLTADADVALLTLARDVEFTRFVRPVCLWPPTTSTDLRAIVGSVGTVVGWGRNEHGDYMTDVPKRVEAPVVGPEECLRSKESFRDIVSERTFCAGSRDGSGPCNGDSGGGFLLEKNGRWILRGIVSTSLYDRELKSCDLNNYVVFTDTAKFSDWILSRIKL